MKMLLVFKTIIALTMMTYRDVVIMIAKTFFVATKGMYLIVMVNMMRFILLAGALKAFLRMRI